MIRAVSRYVVDVVLERVGIFMDGCQYCAGSVDSDETHAGIYRYLVGIMRNLCVSSRSFSTLH